MQTNIIYNNVLILDVLTENISHTPELTTNQVDQVGVTVEASFTGIIHCSTAETNAIGVKVNRLETDIGALLKLLMKTRRRFQMMIGKAAVYDVGPVAAEPGTSTGQKAQTFAGMDINHGPIPHVEVLKITSGNSATIRFSIRFTVPTCDRKDFGTGLINFQWVIAEDIDCKTWLTSRTYTGSLRVAHKHVSTHALARQIAVPPLQRGFRRDVIQLHESEDGLHLHFTVKDTEVFASAPWSPRDGKGAIDWSGTFRMSTQNFSSSESSLNFTLVGPKSTTKAYLMNLGTRIIEAKTHFLALNNNRKTGRADSAFLEQFEVSEEIASNAVAFAVRILHTGNRRQIMNLFSLGGDMMLGKPLGDLGIGYDDQVSFHPQPTATLAGLFLSMLQTPCSPQTMPQIKGDSKEKYKAKSIAGNDEYVLEESVTAYDQGETPSKSHQEAMYLSAELTSELIIHSGKISLPTGASSDSREPSWATVQLFRECAQRHITMAANRVDAAPEFPKPNQDFKDSNGIRHTMIDRADVKATAPQLSADNRKLLYRGRIAMKYAMDRPPGDNEPIPVGALPYRTTTPTDASRKIPSNLFVNPAQVLT